MAGKLVQVATNTVSSAVSSITLTGIDSDDVYMLAVSGIVGSASMNGDLRVTTSGTADTSANYDYATKGLRNDGSAFTNFSSTNQTSFLTAFAWSLFTTSGMTGNGIAYLYNFNNASEYSFISHEGVNNWQNGILGMQGGAFHTLAQACDGINFSTSSGNITSGTFTLYRVV